MKIENIQLDIQRVEIRKRKFNGKEQIYEETTEYYYPEDKWPEIEGFTKKSKKK